MQRILCAILCALALAACAHDTTACPSPVPYTKDEKVQAGAELEQMIEQKQYPMIQRFMGDYKAERAELRACFS